MVLRNVKAALAVCLTVASGYSISSDCSGRVVNGNCIPASPFDVTYEEFNQSTTDFVVFEDGFPFEIKIEATLSPSTYAFMQGMERYAEEMTEWYDRYERQMDEDYIESQNSNTSDATAYAMVYDIRFQMDTDDDGLADRWFWDGDIISGADWNNNGLIDLLEKSTAFDHTVGSVTIN